MTSLIEIFTHAPVWAYVVLALLVVLGIRQAFRRTVDPRLLAVIGVAMIAMSVDGVVGNFGLSATTLLAWAAGFAGATLLLARWLAPTGLRRMQQAGQRTRVEVAGSLLPLAMMLTLFSVKFALGAMKALQVPMLHAPAFVIAISVLCGLASGFFATRAWAVWRCARQAAPVQPTGAGATPAHLSIASPGR